MAGNSVNIKDVAHQAGVALSTASLALNGDSRVAPETLRRVQAAAAALGYVGNQAARRLKSGRCGAIGIAIYPGLNEYHLELAFQVQAAAARRGYSTRFFFIDLSVAENLRPFLEEINGQIDGLLTYSSNAWTAYCQGRNRLSIPYVLLSEPAGDADCVSVDFYGGGRLATEYLLGRGHRRIATYFTSYEVDHPEQPGRFGGYYAAMTEAGLDGRELAVRFDGRWDVYDELYTLSRNILQLRPEAVFIRSDFAALTLLRAICDAGLRPGKDVAFVGFDNIRLGQYSNPSLTTVDCNAGWQAEKLVEILLNRIQGDRSARQWCRSQCSMICRESA